MEPIALNTGMQIIERHECLELLATEELGRLAVVIDGLPQIFPVNYTVDGESIVFRTDLGTKLLGATRSPVAFEVDHQDRTRGTAWSVIVHGLTGQVAEFDRAMLRQRIRQLSLYPGNGSDKPFVLRIAPSSITGRRVAVRVATATLSAAS